MRKISIYEHRNAKKLLDKKFFNQLKYRLEKIDKNYSLAEIKNEVKNIFIEFDYDVPGKNLFPGSNKYLAAIDIENKIGVCHQNGHFGLAYYDFAKIEFLYKRNIIDLAIFICPDEFSSYVKTNAIKLNKIKDDFYNFGNNYNIPILFIGVE
tara:strand:+ start:1735 stop:2190 length:456 start_codon:yes stop_codon:yes gene_type:complete